MCVYVCVFAVVLDNPPQYPSMVIGVLGLLLPIAYLSQWYDMFDLTTKDGRETYILVYVLWLACESGMCLHIHVCVYEP